MRGGGVRGRGPGVGDAVWFRLWLWGWGDAVRFRFRFQVAGRMSCGSGRRVDAARLWLRAAG
ncbi:hypothetical protein HOK021_08900 [Streptomyces hygroscopicus]|nr:hypothetical protein HOK021_08900 [Streptomyces hygroscopicus]